MQPVTTEKVKNALSQVIDRENGRDVMSAGLISGIAVHGDKVGFVVTIEPLQKETKAYLRDACEAAVKKIPGVASVTAVMTAQGSDPIPAKPETGYTQPRERAQWNLTPLEHVKRIVAVASGKGGVGKSSTSVNLAMALSRQGKKVGLLDADIYGPSVPRMMALSGQPDIVNGKMVPPTNHGVKCMSMGFITGDEAAILRGPMISKALQQMLRFTQWGTEAEPLDMLLVDMPPGTGDIHLSMVQQVPLSGAIIVTTPQEVAVIDARKCLQMFQKVNTPILGVIENMSAGMFGTGGGERLAKESGVPFLGAIGMDAAICEASDAGKAYAGMQRYAYEAIAGRLA